MTASPRGKRLHGGLLGSAPAASAARPRSPLVPRDSPAPLVGRRRPRAASKLAGSPAHKRRALHKPQPDPPADPSQWAQAEDEALRAAVLAHGADAWPLIARDVRSRGVDECRERWATLKDVQVKGAWSEGEDALVKVLVSQYGAKRWTQLAALVPGRTGKQCRERWLNHLAPDIKKTPWTDQEDRVLLEAQAELGNQWSRIAGMLEGRTENACKNRWNSLITRSGGSRSAASRAAAARAAREALAATTPLPPEMASALEAAKAAAAASASASASALPPAAALPSSSSITAAATAAAPLADEEMPLVAPPTSTSTSAPFAPREIFNPLSAGFDALDLSQRGVSADDEGMLQNDRGFWSTGGWLLA